MKKIFMIMLTVCLSMFVLTGCNKVDTKKLATEKEISAFIKDKKISKMLDKEYEFEFSYSYELNKSYDKIEEKSKVKMKGRGIADLDTIDVEYYFQGSLDYKKKDANKEKTSISIDEELIYLGSNKVYINYEKTEKTPYLKETTQIKTKNIAESELSTHFSLKVLKAFNELNQIENANYINKNSKIYIDGDKVLVITSTQKTHKEVTFVFDGKTLESIEVLEKTADYESKVQIEIKDKIKTISKPANDSEYKK